MISSLPGISVVVPAYNRAERLLVALDSLVAQDYEKDKFEILIVDNNSSDETRNVSLKYIDDHPQVSIRYIFEPRQGLVYARHAGVKNAAFEILSFTDDDAILSTAWLKEISHVFALNNQVAAVAGKITIRWDETPPEWVLPYEPLLGRLDYGDEIRIEKNLFINGGNFSIKKSVLYQLGGFNPDQIGEWLIGDGETGLCRKLHDAGYLIGWAPKALMEHFQTVKKNATVSDIKRRYINNGRGVPYDIFAVRKQGWFFLVISLIRALAGMIVFSIVFVLSAIVFAREAKYRALFYTAFYSSQFPYTFKLLFDRTFRSYIAKTDWW